MRFIALGQNPALHLSLHVIVVGHPGESSAALHAEATKHVLSWCRCIDEEHATELAAVEAQHMQILPFEEVAAAHPELLREWARNTHWIRKAERLAGGEDYADVLDRIGYRYEAARA